MNFNNFKRIIDEIGDYVYNIDLFNWGEPFFNPDIFEIISYANRRNIGTTVSTHLNFFKEEFAEKIIRSGLERLIISLDGASQETYQKYRIGGDFNKVVQNTRMLVKKKKELRSELPIITIQFLVMKHNEHEIPKIREITRKLGVDNLNLASVIVNIKNKHDAEKWLPLNENYSRYDYEREVDKKMQNVSRCDWLWRGCVINWNGSISPCCWFDEPKYDFGNVFEKSFKEIWNNSLYVSSRNLFRHHNSSIATVCSKCMGRPVPTEEKRGVDESDIS